MTRRTNANPVNENWIKTETKNDYHNQAIRKLAEAKKTESEHTFKTVRIDSKTIILKQIK